jgi:hypothetical protein
MAGPKLPVESRNQYNIVEKKVESDTVMSGPKYPNVDSGNLYSLQLENSQAVHLEQAMVGPV